MIESQVFVFCGHGQEVAGVVGSNPGFFVFHQVEDFVHDILLNQGLLLLQLLGACLEGVVFCGVYIVAQEIFGNAECIPGVAKHQDFVGILLIPQQLPASDVCFVHVFGVVDDAHSAPGVGDGVLILRVINGVFVGLVNILVVGDVVEVQRQEHVFVGKAGDHIV